MAFSTLFLLAQGDAAAQQPGSMMPIVMVLMFVLMYFMIIRPQKRQQQEHQKRLASLKSGDEVVAAGGIHGLITNVSERTVTLKIADGVKIKIEKSSVLSITAKKDDAPAPAAEPTNGEAKA